MATTTLYPNTTVHSAGWSIIGSESTIHESLADDDGTNTGAEADGQDRYIEVGLDNLDSAGLNIDTITSVQAVMQARAVARNQTCVLACSYRDVLGGLIHTYTEDITVTATGTNTEYAWTARTTSNGSTAWSDIYIDGMRLRFTIDTPPSVGNVAVYFLYLIVTYTEVALPKSLSVNGLLTLNGNLTIK